MGTHRSRLISLLGGIVLTLIAGVYSRSLIGFAGIKWHGLPLPWISQTVAVAQASPWQISVIGLIVDVVVWMLVIEVIYLAKETLESDAFKKQVKR